MQGKLRRSAAVVAVAAAALATLALASRPAQVDYRPALPAIEGDPETWLAAEEARIDAGIVPGAEKRVLWHDPDGRGQTEFAVVYLHGFSATRQETAPLAERLAAALGANLFETRLRGHGLERARLEGVTAEDWLRDADEALAIGAELGRRIILVGTSTGATLALGRLAAGDTPPVAALVLMSPNFSPRDPNAGLLTGPAGPLLARLLVGDTHSFEPVNELQERYWTTSYPMAAVVEMMRLVDAVVARLPLELEQPLLVLLSPRDEVIDIARARRALSHIDAPARRIVEVDGGGPSHHVLAGDILAPRHTDAVIGVVLEFLNAHVEGVQPAVAE